MHGEDLGNYAYGLWSLVIFNVLIFSFFILSFIKPQGKIEWASMGAFIGFIAALFTEMYGFPLTIYLLSTWMGKAYPVLNPFSHSHGHLLLVWLGLGDSVLAMNILHFISYAIIFLGFYLIQKGWILIHNAGGKKLVTEGIYQYMRNPQYSGIFLITLGFLVQWPSLLSFLMWPILMFAYYRLAMREEKAVEAQFGKFYLDYKKRVPAFVPKLRK